jgi:hypothetical protein
LTPKQAKWWFEQAHRNAATTEKVGDQEILDNPYRSSEVEERTVGDPAVAVGTIDRGLLPDPTVVAKCPVPDRSRVGSPADRRVRGAWRR